MAFAKILDYTYAYLIMLAKTTKLSKREKKDMFNTKKVNIIDNYFRIEVTDPYRWLENDTSKETATWVQTQNKITSDYFSKIPFT
ncbi:MAG: hypothetical protein LBI80_01125 [Endomicrobium sp.]|nr:hypothetical protein [Endomicrobium sp.]